MCLEDEEGELGDGHLVSFWTIGFAVPIGRLPVGSREPKSERWIEFMFRKSRFGKWSLICSG